MIPGDCCVLRCVIDAKTVFLGSFHADSDGRTTLPFMEAFISRCYGQQYLLGVDANAHAIPDKNKLGIDQIREKMAKLGAESCWPEDVWTTFKARTYIQEQFQKAVRKRHLHEKSDKGPKDHILFSKEAACLSVARDTTGEGRFVDMPIPTVGFPSDHCIVEAEVLLNLSDTWVFV